MSEIKNSLDEFNGSVIALGSISRVKDRSLEKFQTKAIQNKKLKEKSRTQEKYNTCLFGAPEQEEKIRWKQYLKIQ